MERKTAAALLAALDIVWEIKSARIQNLALPGDDSQNYVLVANVTEETAPTENGGEPGSKTVRKAFASVAEFRAFFLA